MLRISLALHGRMRMHAIRLKGRASIPRTAENYRSIAQFSNFVPKNDGQQPPEPTTEQKSLATTLATSVKGACQSMIEMIRNPKETWKMIKDVANHYWLGSKLLWSEIKVAREIVGRILEGHSMTRRERIQLIRTTTDIFRLVPFSIFVIVPFMELLLPFALKLFPNMLPSTFQDSLKAEESMKKELQMRLAVAKFMQETLQQMAEKKGKQAGQGQGGADKEAASGAKEVIEFVEKARLGEHIPNDQVLRIAKLFKDELTLANVTRPQLVGMCQYMGLQPYGADSFLRFQLRAKLRALQEDDRRILWEGIDSLNTIELRDACRERGMRSIGMTQFRLKKQLEEWLELSTQKGIPIFLLIMSRAFMLSSSGESARTAAAGGAPGSAASELSSHNQALSDPSDPDQVLKSSMSFLDADTINEVVLEAASSGEVDTAEMRRRRLESIQFQKELMEEERQEQEGAAKSRKSALLPPSAAPSTAAILPDDAEAPHSSGSVTSSMHPKEERAGDRAVGNSGLAGDTMALQPATAKPVGIVEVKPPPAALVELRAAASESGRSASTTALDNTSSEKPELTIHELVTLSDLARGNSLRREMSELTVLEAFIESLPIDALPRGGAQPSRPKAGASGIAEAERESSSEDKSVMMMKSVISKMVGNLKVKINTTEKVLGDKLKVLDRDGDGQISFEEIKDVVSTVMKKGAATEEHIAQLFDVLDSNKDGKVSVAELLQYIHNKKESREVELLEEQRKEAAAAAAAAKASISKAAGVTEEAGKAK